MRMRVLNFYENPGNMFFALLKNTKFWDLIRIQAREKKDQAK